MKENRLSSVQKICAIPDPYAQGNDAIFVDAMREIIEWHIDHSDFYKRAAEAQGFSIDTLKVDSPLSEIPWIPAQFFKTHELLSVPREQIAMHLTSSGTSGQKSQMFFDQRSLSAGQKMVDVVFESSGWITPDSPTNYLLYTYETEPDSKLGTAYTDHFLCKYAPVNSAFHALRRTGAGSHEFDVFGCIETLRQYEKQGLPVRIFGFPAFFYFTLKRMRDLGVKPLALSGDSLVFLGGGWKGHADQAIEKHELYSMATALLGIPDHRIRDSFGAVEHGIPYAECVRHRFHVPAWSRVLIRDVATLEPVSYGKKGFLQFLTPYITSVTAHSVLMGDLASLHPAEECGCGIGSPFFVIHGRAGTSKNKSCAVAASELLRGRK
jgi:phenylacetate-coenzyme A ligase PaaK-like adenylate-forming protein